MKKKTFVALGLMTGTSMDGVDLSLIKSDGESDFHSILDNYYEFDNNLRQNLINLREKLRKVEDLTKNLEIVKNLERQVTLFHAEIINDLSKKINYEIDLIGFHGQTIFHSSNDRISRQLGDGKLLSQITKKIVINEFRKKDIKNGGQGAPLSPIFHDLLSKKINNEHDISYPINFMNIGGITNITQIIKDDKKNDTKFFAYDIAPGNCLIDEWIRKKSKEKFDFNGEISKSGKVNDLILNQTIDNFELDNYDTSLDIGEFDISFAKGLSLEDGGATITKFTAYLIAKGIEKVSKSNKVSPCKILVCGGGRKNKFLLDSITENFSDSKYQVENIDKYGLNGDFIESQTFGYLAIRSFLGLPISYPNTTRCKNPTTGGQFNKNF